jgi:hypothetical protein
MILDQFWLTEAQFSKIAPHLPTDTRGKARVDDSRVIIGIVQFLNLADAGSTRRRKHERAPIDIFFSSLSPSLSRSFFGSVPRPRPICAASSKQN